MRLLRSLFVASIIVPGLIACGGSDTPPPDNDPFDTFQDCWDDHHNGADHFSVQDSIKICCIDHPIGVPPVGPNVVCGETAAACQTYVDDNLDANSATVDDITAACDQYIIDRSM